MRTVVYKSNVYVLRLPAQIALESVNVANVFGTLRVSNFDAN